MRDEPLRRIGFRARAGRVGAAVTALVLGVIALSWLARPEYTSQFFGVPLEGQLAAYGRVKGAEDLLAAALLGAFVVRREGPALALACWLALIVPAGDFVALLSVGKLEPQFLATHVVFLVVMIASASALRGGD